MDFEQELRRVAENYQNQGYSILVRPGPDELPPFAKDFKVEILGKRGTEGVFVAVKRNRNEFAADTNMQRYAEVIGQQPDWRFDIALLEAENPKAREIGRAPEFSEADIARELEQAEQLNRMGFTRAAVIAAWAALEAAMRIRLRAFGTEAGWGSVPRTMLRELYSAGILSPDEFRRVDEASQTRNQIVHGFSSTLDEGGNGAVTLVQLLSDVARRLVGESHPVKQIA